MRPNSTQQKLKRQMKATERRVKSQQAAVKAAAALKNSSKIKYNGKSVSGWKRRNVSAEVGKKKYTEGQKDYIRALKTIEDKLGVAADTLKMKYGSDDIEELANQYYISDLSDFSDSQIKEIESEFNKTHGYKVRLEKATNPFKDIDFLNM